MWDWVTAFFSSDGFMPHGMCYLWRPGVLTLHVTSDALITLAYFSIPFTLLRFVRQRKDLEFSWMLVCFAVFIIACGTTHLMEIWTIWQPRYWLSGAIKAVTALASVPTAILLVKLVPQAVRLPSPSALQQLNETLEREIAERRLAESEVRRFNAELEVRVARRTAELEAINSQLREQIGQRVRAEQSLRTNQSLMRAVLDNSSAVIYAKDRSFRYLLVNRQFEEVFGLGRSAILGRTDYELFSHEVADRFRGMDQRVIEADQSLTEEEVAPHPDGPHSYISVKAPLRDETGQLIGMFGISTDITDRRRAEQAFHESQQLLQRIVESSDDAILTKDLSGTITSWNRGAERLFGYTAQQTVGRHILMLIPPERADEEPRILERLRRGESVDHFETERVRADGFRVEISATISPIRDESGRVIGISKIARDITERRSHERRTRVQLERLNLLRQISRAMGQRQDLRSIFQVVVRSLEDHLALDFCCVGLYEPGTPSIAISCVGVKSGPLSLELALPEQSQVRVDENGLSKCLRGQLVYEADIQGAAFEFPARLAAAGLRSLVITPLSIEDEVFGVIIAARREPESFLSADCEFLKQLSEHVALASHQAQLYSALQRAYDDLRQTQLSVMQQERLRALGQMAGGIAHDINNALSPAAIYAQLLLLHDDSLSEEAREYLGVIQSAIDGVGQTVSRLRMFYRPRDLEPARSPVDLNSVLRQVADLTRARWSDMPQERGIVIRLVHQLSSDIPPVLGVEHEIRDGLVNLVLNAVDAMPAGGTLTLTSVLESGEVAGGAPRVRIAVTDTGMGMSESVRSRCLEPFFTTKGERGTGLGLAMVYGMVERHGGDLQIDSAPGQGTTISLRFAAAAQRSPTQVPVVPQSRPLRILLVDDDPLLLKSLRDVLESEGHDIAAADGGQAGIDLFLARQAGRQPFELVITDLGMPNVDGRTVASQIRAASASVPIILLTGWGTRLQERESLPAVDRILDKPPRVPELRAAIADLTAGPSSGR